jgi:hypothetical protein
LATPPLRASARRRCRLPRGDLHRLDFGQVTVRRWGSFEGCTFNRSLSFAGTTFGAGVLFVGARVPLHRPEMLRGTKFPGDEDQWDYALPEGWTAQADADDPEHGTLVRRQGVPG